MRGRSIGKEKKISCTCRTEYIGSMLRLPFRNCQSLKTIHPRISSTATVSRINLRTVYNPQLRRIRLYATMSQSHACCTVPPVVSDGYKEKGEYITIDGMKTYATGPSHAKSALLVVYDIFGFFPQTLQGADILAHGDKEKQYQVFMPGSSSTMFI